VSAFFLYLSLIVTLDFELDQLIYIMYGRTSTNANAPTNHQPDSLILIFGVVVMDDCLSSYFVIQYAQVLQNKLQTKHQTNNNNYRPHVHIFLR
jgi:hypothetical protein